MAFGTATIVYHGQLTGGPKIVIGTQSAASGDTSDSIDLSAYFANQIDWAMISVENQQIAAVPANDEVGVQTTDITTDPKALAYTIADPLATIVIKFMALGR